MAAKSKTPGAFGEPAGRLAELMAETVTPEPYRVTTKIVIDPPTKRAARKMNEAHMQVFVCQTLLAAALNQVQAPKPARPETDDPQQLAEWENAVAEWEKGTKLAQEQLNSLRDEIAKAQDDWNRAFFGDQYDNVVEYFEDRPQKLWEAFEKDIKARFLPPEPEDGKCPSCGRVIDEEAAGKEPSSST